MEVNNQTQKAGDNSQQIQAGTVNIYNNGITEERARKICTEVAQKAIEEFSVIANNVANDRIRDFGNELIPRVEKTENGLQAFSDPAFQVLLRKAQITAACSEREGDYKILSELLVHRVKNKSDIKKKASIMKAVEIIDQIDDDSLCGLTIYHLAQSIVPKTGNISNGLSDLSRIYAKFNLSNLPTDGLWIDNLSILDTVTRNTFYSLSKFDDLMCSTLNGYACTGLKVGGEDYQNAIKMLHECGLDERIFVENELLNGYVRLPTNGNIDQINKEINNEIYYLKIDNEKMKCLGSIFNMYDTDEKLKKETKRNFIKLMDSHSSIKTVKDWWDNYAVSLSLTSIGKIIAHTYAKSIDNTLPDLDK